MRKKVVRGSGIYVEYLLLEGMMNVPELAAQTNDFIAVDLESHMSYFTSCRSEKKVRISLSSFRSCVYVNDKMEGVTYVVGVLDEAPLSTAA